jgi:hypothetical protein
VDGDPSELIMDLVRQGYVWDIDWSRATEQETFLWGQADMVGRILRALSDGRPVFFQGTEYRATPETIKEVAGQVEDAIANSGYMVVVEADDEQGVRIGIRGTEHPV